MKVMRNNDPDSLGSSNKQPKASEQSKEEAVDEVSRSWHQPIIGAAVILALFAILFVGYRVAHGVDRGDEANSFARTFIQSSPVVLEQVGKVEQIKQAEKMHQQGQHSGWDLHYDVVGSRGKAAVDMLLTPNPNYGIWNVPKAKIIQGHEELALR
ncbi:MAG TPA: hypothetical protein VMF50_17805 [Candidatus Binataceae bacterium]|nr:hypothetical protein [Candidatus Binataceae bacterium]